MFWVDRWAADKSSQHDCDILFLRYELEMRLRAVYLFR